MQLVFWYKLKILKRMKVLVWRLALRHGTVRGTTRSQLRRKLRFIEERTHLWVLLIMLLWSRHQVAIRRTIWKARDLLPIDVIPILTLNNENSGGKILVYNIRLTFKNLLELKLT